MTTQWKLYLSFLLIAVPIVAVVLYGAAALQDLAVAHLRNQTARLIDVAAAVHQGEIENARNLLTVIGPELFDVTDPEAADCRAILSRYAEQLGEYSTLARIEPSGDVLCSSEQTDDGMVINVGDHRHFRTAVRERRPVLGGYVIDQVTGTAVAPLAVPVVNGDGSMRFIVSTGIGLRWLNGTVGQISVPVGTELSIVDRQGMVLASHPTGAESVGDIYPDGALVEVLGRGHAGPVAIEGLDGRRRLAEVAALGGDETGAFVLASMPSEGGVLPGPAPLWIWGSIVLAAASGGGVFLVCRMVHHQVDRPVTILSDATEAIAKQDYTVSVPALPGRLNHLGLVFNDMIRALDRHERQSLEQAEALLSSIEDLRGQSVDLRFMFETMEEQATSLAQAAEDREIIKITLEAEIEQRRELEDQLRIMATTDELTGLFNRRQFLNRAREEIERTRRYDRPLALIMADVDHFKLINDRYGHDVGDTVLRKLAELFKGSLRRDVDVVARLGGEEFAFLLPETTAAKAFVLAMRLNGEVRRAEIDWGAVLVPVTCSFGVVECMSEGENVERLLKAADLALYRAKAEGRDRVVLDEPAAAMFDLAAEH